MSVSTAFDPQVFRTVLGHYPTGVVVVTGTTPDGEHLAMVVGTFSSVSLDPPLVSFMPMKGSATYLKLTECQSLCINVLTADQEDVGRMIVSRRGDKLADIDWSPSPSGAPVLAGCLAWLEVRLIEQIEAGDHWISLCAVDHLAVENPVAPLLFFQGGYGAFVVPSLIARLDAEIASGVNEAVASRAELEQLAADIEAECTLLKVVNRDELAAVATAGAPGRSLEPGPGLGRRLPIIPPIADTWVAGRTVEEQNYWLSKATGADEASLDTYRRRLQFCREHGYLLSFRRPEERMPFEQLHEATSTYAQIRPTPAQLRELRQQITAATPPESHEIRDLIDDQTYDVGSIIVPVRDAAGDDSLVLRASNLPPGASAAQVRSWVERVKSTARQIETSIRDA